MRLPRMLAALAALASASLASSPATTTVRLSVPATPQLPNPRALSPATRATLTGAGGHRAVALLTAPDGGDNNDASNEAVFVFRGVPAGSYLADVHGGGYAWAPLRVDVGVAAAEQRHQQQDGGSGAEEAPAAVVARAWETFRGNEWDNRGPEARPLTPGKGFPVRPVAQKVYYAERGSFSILGILKNPMILMGIVSMGLFIGLPKLMENMDPEMRAEFEKQQQSNPMASLMGAGGGGGGSGGADMDVAGFLSGHSSSKKDEGGEGPPTSGKKGGGSRR